MNHAEITQPVYFNQNLKSMKTNFISSTFIGITFLLIAGCASMTQAPSTPPSATVKIEEWSAAYYGSAAAGKGTLYYNGQRHHFTSLVSALAERAANRSLPLAKSIT
jgi:hypothetical protein